MTFLASLPMYDWPEVRHATSAFWGHLRDALRDGGFDAPDALENAANNRDIWQSPGLLFSQTCGYPYITELTNDVHPLWRPSCNVEGCGEGTYSSAIVVRRGETRDIEAFRGKNLAHNSRDSLSGYRCLSPLIGLPHQFFGEMLECGAHRVSAQMVVEGRADIAAIDAVCWDMVQRFDPQVADALEVMRWAPEFPALPFITSIRADGETKQRIALAVLKGVDASLKDEACAALKIKGLTHAHPTDYTYLLAL